MRLIKIILISFSLLILFPLLGNAQSSCVQNLREARNFYDAGKLNELPKLLLKCIDNGFTDEEKVEALRLVTLSYLFDEEQEKAEATYLRLLKIEPEYQVDEDSDPTELIILSERYDTEPKFFFGIKGSPSYNILEDTPFLVYNKSELGSYDPPIGISGGLFFQYPINNEFSVNLETYYNFRRTDLNREINRTEGSSTVNHEISETQQWIEVPLLLNYKIPLVEKFLLEATAGPSFHYLLYSNLNIKNVNREINNKDMLEYRNQMNLSGILGLRGNFKIIGRHYVTVEALFQYRFIEENRELNYIERFELLPDLIQAGYAEGKLKGHAFMLRVGFRFPRFNPELVK
ncbi:MAG: outer membrane beta-barrel protein [Bacteroidota bacterium]